MWCDRILRNLGDGAAAGAGREVDLIDLLWHECGRRALRKTSRGGRAVRIVLPPGAALRHGDVLAEDAGGGTVLAVHVVPTDVLVVRPRSLAEMGAVALDVGNLHAPAEVAGDELLVLPDGPIEAVLSRLGVAYAVESRRFTPTPSEAAPAFRLAGGFGVVRRP